MKRALVVLVMLCAVATARAQSPTFRAPDEHTHLAPIVVPRPAPEPTDKRPFLLVGGVLVLAAVFLWNREREKKLEREHGPTSPRQRRWKVKPDGESGAGGDDDGEALQEAAKGDDHDEEGKS